MRRLVQDKENDRLPSWSLRKIYKAFAVMDQLDDQVYWVYAKTLEDAKRMLHKAEGNSYTYLTIKEES